MLKFLPRSPASLTITSNPWTWLMRPSWLYTYHSSYLGHNLCSSLEPTNLAICLRLHQLFSLPRHYMAASFFWFRFYFNIFNEDFSDLSRGGTYLCLSCQPVLIICITLNCSYFLVYLFIVCLSVTLPGILFG